MAWDQHYGICVYRRLDVMSVLGMNPASQAYKTRAVSLSYIAYSCLFDYTLRDSFFVLLDQLFR